MKPILGVLSIKCPYCGCNWGYREPASPLAGVLQKLSDKLPALTNESIKCGCCDRELK